MEHFLEVLIAVIVVAAILIVLLQWFGSKLPGPIAQILTWVIAAIAVIAILRAGWPLLGGF